MQVTVKLMGGLGNQLFQYAMARALAEKRGGSVVLDTSSYAAQNLRRYELGAYRLPVKIRDNKAYRSGLIGRLLGRLSKHRTSDAVHYIEPHFHFDEASQQKALPLAVDGYWQSEKYFSEIADLLRRELTPQQSLKNDNLEIAEKISACNAISLHVRRGDYVTNAKTNAYHGTCDLEYYCNAVAYMAQHVENPHFFIFSDDPAWTKDNIRVDHPVTYVTANPADAGCLDLELMRRCQHHIIANSSFSWWGAWLNGREDKIVVAPKNWFAASEHDTRDLLPNAWIRL